MKDLVLLAKGLRERFPVRIEKILAALLPGRSEFRRSDAPVGRAFPGDRPQVLGRASKVGRSKDH